MDKSLSSITPSFSLAKTMAIALLLGILLVGIAYGLHQSDPYTQEVLALPGKISQGQAIFQANCSVCHGVNGLGNIGPNLEKVSQHKSSARLIEQVVSGKTPPMPKFQPDAQTMADLLSYLESL